MHRLVQIYQLYRFLAHCCHKCLACVHVPLHFLLQMYLSYCSIHIQKLLHSSCISTLPDTCLADAAEGTTDA